jgi:plastocyanin
MSILMVNRSGLLRTAIALLGMVGFVNNGPSAAVAGETRKVSVERKAADSLTAQYQRPTLIPFPNENPFTLEKAASATLSCASCLSSNPISTVSPALFAAFLTGGVSHDETHLASSGDRHRPGIRCIYAKTCGASAGRMFSVETISIKKGDTLIFISDDNVPHNIASITLGNEFNLDSLRPGASTDETFTEAGEAQVICTFIQE